MTQPVTSPFRWAEDKRPSIFNVYPFNGKGNNTRPNAQPKASTNFNTPITTLAQSDRTQSIKGRM